MNYIKCFSRSRSAKNLQTVFCLCARLVSRWHQARSIATAAHLRPSGVPLASGMEYCHGCTLRPPWFPTPSNYTHYSISQILEFLAVLTLLAARYRLYRTSRRLGNCEHLRIMQKNTTHDNGCKLYTLLIYRIGENKLF